MTSTEIAIAIADDVEKGKELDEERPYYILPILVVSQFAGTSLWFSGNAVLPDLLDQWGLPESSLTYVTSSLNFGFICGTLVFAVFNIADYFSPVRVFGICAMMGAAFNALIPAWQSLGGLIVLRIFTGFTLAGIYPVGMKVAADWFPHGTLGRALGWLVGATTVGCALPFLLLQIPQSYQALLWETSAFAAFGGLIVALFIPNGPYRKASPKLDPSVMLTPFRTNKPFRSAAFGYFGHIWELYALWTWTPVVWKAYLEDQNSNWDASIVTFGVVAMGGIGCVLGGFLSERYGSAKVAFYSLATSRALCCLSPLLYLAPPVVNLMAFLLWGVAVMADSPQLSSLVAQTYHPEYKGTALTIVNCLGYLISIGSIQLFDVPLPEQFLFLLLAPGPLFGLWNLRSLVFEKKIMAEGTERTEVEFETK
jgi:MFS family permease